MYRYKQDNGILALYSWYINVHRQKNMKSNNNKNWRCWLHHDKHIIPIKMNFKQITMVKVKFIQYSEGDYVTLFSFYCSFNDATLLCFFLHSKDMTAWLNSSAKIVECNVAAIFDHHTVVIQHLVSDILYQTGDFR